MSTPNTRKRKTNTLSSKYVALALPPPTLRQGELFSLTVLFEVIRESCRKFTFMPNVIIQEIVQYYSMPVHLLGYAKPFFVNDFDMRRLNSYKHFDTLLDCAVHIAEQNRLRFERIGQFFSQLEEKFAQPTSDNSGSINRGGNAVQRMRLNSEENDFAQLQLQVESSMLTESTGTDGFACRLSSLCKQLSVSNFATALKEEKGLLSTTGTAVICRDLAELKDLQSLVIVIEGIAVFTGSTITSSLTTVSSRNDLLVGDPGNDMPRSFVLVLASGHEVYQVRTNDFRSTMLAFYKEHSREFYTRRLQLPAHKRIINEFQALGEFGDYMNWQVHFKCIIEGRVLYCSNEEQESNNVYLEQDENGNRNDRADDMNQFVQIV